MSPLLDRDYLAHEASLVSGLRWVGRVMFAEAAEWEMLGDRAIAEILDAYGVCLQDVARVAGARGEVWVDEQLRAGWVLAAAEQEDPGEAVVALGWDGAALDADERDRHRRLLDAARQAWAISEERL